MAFKLLGRQFNLKFIILNLIKITLEDEAVQFKNSYLITITVFKQISIVFISESCHNKVP